MSPMTPTQADRLLELVNRATGRRYRSLSQAARHFGMSGGAVARVTGPQAEALVEEWAARPEYAQPWTAETPHGASAAAAGDGAMSAEQAASVLGHELFVTTAAAPDGLTFIPDAVELLDDGRPVLRGRVALAEITSWSMP
jgi:hypothetical protein